MVLRSNLFAGDATLQGVATVDSRRVAPGAVGPHVGKIQVALAIVDRAPIDSVERAMTIYGPGTAAAVLAYKQARSIVDSARQSEIDDSVGVTTIARLDSDLFARQTDAPRSIRSGCARLCRCLKTPFADGFGPIMQRRFQAVAL